MKDARPLLLDRAAIRRHADRASAGYDAAAVLSSRLREDLIRRLEWVAFVPEAVLDLGCGTGHGAAALALRWPRARVIALDASAAMLAEAARREGVPDVERLLADAESIPMPDASVDLVFSNLMLPWCEDIDAVFAEVARILKPRGLFTFTTLGPDTLVELRAAWQAADCDAVLHPFTDMHDLGGGLVRAGFAEPVLDVSRFTFTYPGVPEILRDLKATGAQNASSGRLRGLTGRKRMDALVSAYEDYRSQGTLPASVEAVFGHAWGALQRGRQDHEFAVPVADVGRRERRGR